MHCDQTEIFKLHSYMFLTPPSSSDKCGPAYSQNLCLKVNALRSYSLSADDL